MARIAREHGNTIRLHGKKAGSALLRGYGGKRVEIEWGSNEAMRQDQVVKIRIGDQHALVGVQDLYRILRNT